MRNLSKIANRLCTLGIRGTAHALTARTHKKLFACKWRQKAQELRANHHTAPKPHDIVAPIRQNPHFLSRVPVVDHIKRANDACNNCFDLLGSGKRCFVQIPWHTDFKTSTPPFPLAFYQDIHPSFETPTRALRALAGSSHASRKASQDTAGRMGEEYDGYVPDIKVPWELSRFQHVYHLGVAYEQTQDHKYADSFARHVTDWIEKNPFLLGVNWVCPMDVALRAINLIWGYSFFKDSDTLPAALTNSLFDHLIYLESNWETSDKPNNHYISDLVGYLYLTSFFQLKKKRAWCVKKLLEQMDHQVQPDGTSYEGSTAYHQLVTELFWHVQLLSAAQRITLPQSFHEKLNKMFMFLDAVRINEQTIVHIGDDDSGKVVTGIKPASLNGLHHFLNFGLTVIANDGWHITYRHPTFAHTQPSGHFHRDELAVTLSINGIPILIDPGSYLYTAHPTERNQFRSSSYHNTFAPVYQKSFPHDLFQLDRTAQPDTAHVFEDRNNIVISNNTGFCQRTLTLERTHARLTLTDQHMAASKQSLSWYFIFHPNVNVIQHSPTTWHIIHNKKIIAQLKSSLNFKLVSEWYSPEYGAKKSCAVLTVQHTLNPNSPIVTQITKI